MFSVRNQMAAHWDHAPSECPGDAADRWLFMADRRLLALVGTQPNSRMSDFYKPAVRSS